jgi:UDP-N-acetylmuramoylalanine--D-glutamate ligase
MTEYAQAKANIFLWPPSEGEVFLGNHHEWYEFWRAQVPATSHLHTATTAEFVAAATQWPHPHILGSHNNENVALAVMVAQQLGIANEIIGQAVRDFSGVAYRLQTVADSDGVRFINDTTSTTPTALEKALDALAGTKFILI